MVLLVYVFWEKNILQSPRSKGFVFLAIAPSQPSPKPPDKHLYQHPINARAVG
jgi:hypothetical protein